MIHIANSNKYLNFDTPLLEYLKRTFNYSVENLLFSTKYTSGTFTITNPTPDFKNCKFVNGYPHFHIPLNVCMDEIDFFMNDCSLYNNKFIIRYGDSHPHNPIPKLGQTRNLIIADYLTNIIGTNAKQIYTIGDISIKSLKDFISINKLDIDPDYLYSSILNNTINDSLKEKLETYDNIAIEEIKKFINNMFFLQPEFLLESSLYNDQEFYMYLKKSPQFSEYIKTNGEIKYTLQELMFIKNALISDKDVLINVIGFDQSDHIIKVNNIINEEKMNFNSRFLSYEICKNSLEKNVDVWSSKLEMFIEKNNLKIGNRYITYQELLKILFIINSNDISIDFDNLNKCLNNIKRFCYIYSKNIIDESELNNSSLNIEKNNLFFKMVLVNYTLNRTVELGEPNHFYKYILDIITEYQKNNMKYKDIENLYYRFIKKCFDRLGVIYNYTYEGGIDNHVLSKKN